MPWIRATTAEPALDLLRRPSRTRDGVGRAGQPRTKALGTTKGRVSRKNCSVGICVASPQQAAPAVKWLISMAHFPTVMAMKMHDVVYCSGWLEAIQSGGSRYVVGRRKLEWS